LAAWLWLLLGAFSAVVAAPVPGPRVHVFFANYKNEQDLSHSIRSHMLRQQLPQDALAYTVLNMGTEDTNRMEGIAGMHTGGKTVSIIDFDDYPANAVGGSVLPYMLQRVNELTTGAITVISDSDVFMLHDAWDVYLEELMDIGYSLASINPRGETINGPSSVFADTPEWNWLAYKSVLWSGAIRADAILREFTAQHLVDWGHWFKYHSKENNLGTIYLWPGLRLAFPGKSAVIVGFNTPFAVHCFYGSRTRNEKNLGSEEMKWVMSHEEKLRLYRMAVKPAITHSLEALDEFALKA